jgi:hypothetical protein
MSTYPIDITEKMMYTLGTLNSSGVVDMSKTTTIIGDTKVIDFLQKEYSECFSHAKHYENITDSYVKFLTGGYPVIIGGISALYAILDVSYRNIVASVLLLLTFIAGFAILTILITNRSYYVVVVRQINAIRRYFLIFSEKLDFFIYNKAYIDSSKPHAFNLTSSSTWLFFVVDILNSLVGAGFIFFILYQYNLSANILWDVSGASLAFFVIVQGLWCYWYLGKKEKVHIEQTFETIDNEIEKISRELVALKKKRLEIEKISRELAALKKMRLELEAKKKRKG